jgi:hypothetical protein
MMDYTLAVVIVVVIIIITVAVTTLREALLPTNGYELPYAPFKWNLPPMVINHNCYDYAFNHYDPIQRITSQPGNLPNSVRDTLGNDYTCALTDSRLERDHDNSNTGKDLLFAKSDTVCPKHMYKIALVMDPDDDYHFLRQNADGTWSHKPGSGLVTNRDFSGNIITDPQTANMNSHDYNYSNFCSYFCISTDAKKNFRK